MLKPYIGTQIVFAEKMDEVSFKVLTPEAGDKCCTARPGYRVRYSTPIGCYDRWEPQEMFEKRHREIPAHEVYLLEKTWEAQKK